MRAVLSPKTASTIYQPPSDTILTKRLNPLKLYETSKKTDDVLRILKEFELIRDKCFPSKKRSYIHLQPVLKERYARVAKATSFILDQLSPFKNKKIQNELYTSPSPLLLPDTVSIFRAMLRGYSINITGKLTEDSLSSIYRAQIGTPGKTIKMVAKELKIDRSFYVSRISSFLLGREDALFAQYYGFVDHPSKKKHKLMLYKLYERDLFNLSKSENFTPLLFRKAIHDTVRALLVIQKIKKRIYCDLKPENILYDKEKGSFVLGDYDDSIDIVNKSAFITMTEDFSPPETVPDSPCSKKDCSHSHAVSYAFDIWSLGALILDLLSCGKLRVPKDKYNLTRQDIFSMINKSKISSSSIEISNRIRKFDSRYLYLDLMLECFTHKPEERPDIEKVIEKLADIESVYSSSEKSPLKKNFDGINSQIGHRTIGIRGPRWGDERGY